MKKIIFSSLKVLPKLNTQMTLMQKTPNINKIRSISSINKSDLAFNNNSSCKTSRKITKIKKTLEIIHKLNLESNIRDIYMEEKKLEKKREKINENQEIKEKRLGLFKEKESDSEEDKDKQNNIQSIINEMSMEKLGTKEKEKKIEKLYHRCIKELQIIENDIIKSTKEIIELSGKIENDKLEINVIDQYGENIDRQQVNSEIPTRVEERKKTLRENKNKSKNKKQGMKRMSVVLKIDDIEKESKIMIKKHQRNERQKQMKSKVDIDMEQLDKLQKENDKLKEKSANLKKQIIDLKKELINIYHSQLYEGLEFKGPGLASLIINIWNLGVNIDKNFMPTYLDKISVDFLFKKARQIIEKSKLKKQLEEAELDFSKTVRKWKEEETLINENNNNFFKTNISEDESYYDQYPKTKLFMKAYRKKHVKETDKVENIKFNNNIFKSRNIPGLIIEKNKKVDKMKYLLQAHRNQMEKDEKNEILRLSKEFLYNDYGKTYEVCIETIIGALCGEDHKDAQLNYYNKIKKEYKDDLKKIEFFKKLPKNKLKQTYE